MESEKKNDNKKVNLKIEAAGGLAAGIIGTVIGYPLDLVKTRMQTSSNVAAAAGKTTSASTTASPNTQSKNLFQIGYSIARSEGFSALYKGMTPPLISLCILNTMTFTSYNYIRTQYGAKRGFDIRNAAAGITTAPLASVISTVEHLLKTQMQLDNINERRFSSSWQCLTTFVREHGSLRILYLGYGVNTIREGVFIGTYFYTYEGMRIKLDQIFSSRARSDGEDYFNDGNQKAKAWTIPFAGGCAGAWAWFVSFPLDCVKAGVQGQSLSTLSKTTTTTSNGIDTVVSKRIKNENLKSMSTVYLELIKSKGWKGLYSGVSPSIMRAFIVSSSRFTAYELVVKLCGDYLR